MRCLCALLLASATATKYELLDYNPVAASGAVKTYGNARFTVLTDQLIRMEYAESGKFEDRSTLAFVNRALPVPKFTENNDGKTATITTSKVTLTYTMGQPFSASTLSAKGDFGSWAYGNADTGNLLGTIKSLDELGVTSLNCTENKNIVVHGEQLHCQWALISRLGWAVVDDSRNQALDEEDWWAGNNTDTIDSYLFAHGHDYMGALSDYVKVGGKTAMVPRQASGIWWTRWFDLNNRDVIKVVDDYKSRQMPLDIFVLDMDWHKKNDWSGFTFDKELFPYPQDSMEAIKRDGLLLSANIHDASGIGSWEDQYKPLAAKLNFDTSTNTSIPFSMIDKNYVRGVEDIVLGVIEDERIGGTVGGSGVGMDFWWIDWQQGGDKGGCAGGSQNPTIWTNKIRCTDAKRRGAKGRNMVLARWGGLGTHRYQVGFSGDVKHLTWANLAYQPYFSFTSSNVGYGFWSHDIEGPAGDLEMYTRWIQWASYSAVFRSHDRGMSGGTCEDQPDRAKECSIVKPWDVPTQFFEANRAAMQARSALLPYIYTQHRIAYDTGVSILRPMYYHFPEADMAYAANQDGAFPQYFFGPSMFISPVVRPAQVRAPVTLGFANASGVTTTDVWVPPGEWFEESTGAMHTGAAGKGTVVSRTYNIDEIPVFVKAGAVVARHPMSTVHREPVGRSSRANERLEFTIYPTSASGATGSSTVYEDDGSSTDYSLGTAHSANTVLSYTSTSANSYKATITTTGGYAAMLPATRSYSVKIPNSMPVTSASCGSTPATYTRWADDHEHQGGHRHQSNATWSYDGDSLAVVVTCGGVSIAAPFTITIATANGASMSGMVGGIRRANAAKVVLDVTRQTLGAHKPVGGMLKTAASTGEALAYMAGKDIHKFADTVSGFAALYTRAVSEVMGMSSTDSQLATGKVDPTRLAYAQALVST
jgi:alpha-glucosidase (family GH31 glycosyl hydrolase)